MKTDHTLTAERLRELMRYDDGALYWRNPDANPKYARGPVGSPAGRAGRLQVHVDGVARYVHRLIWLYHHSEWPSEQVDHINGNKHDNRIENMRVLTNTQNTQNVDRNGVSFERRSEGRGRPWRARIMADGKSISLGYYATREEAHTEYLRAKRVYHSSWVTGAGQAA